MQNNFDGARLERMKNRVVEAAAAISKTLKSTSI